MLTLNEIFIQALDDPKGIITKNLNRQAVMSKGVIIQRFPNRIEILNMGKGGDFFKLCTEEEYKYFYKGGWIKGALNLQLSNCLYKLKIVERRIKREVNTRKNDKHIQNLKNRRETILLKYTGIQRKLNLIKSKSNGKIELF